MEFIIDWSTGGKMGARMSNKREIRTVEDLKKLAEEYADSKGRPADLMISFDGWGPGDPTIEIHNE